MNITSGAYKIICLLFGVFLLLMTACRQAPPPFCVRFGVAYCKSDGIFVGKWFDYYSRALSCIEGECYAAALSDLNKALSVRSEDERMVRTYGMHFIDYFPHREKGLIHFLQEDYDSAKSELERSLMTEPSAKAYFYLNEVRKKILKRDQASISKPDLILDVPDSEVWTNDDPVILSGSAQDSQYVSEIVILDKERPSYRQSIFIEDSRQTWSFREKLALEPGRHEITVAVKNLLGGQTEKQVVIHADRKGPLIIIEDIIPNVQIKGAATDETEIASVYVNEYLISPKIGRKIIYFEAPIRGGSLTIQAADKAGNQTKAFIQNIPLFQSKNVGIISAALMSDAYQAPYIDSSPEIKINSFQDHDTVYKESVVLEGSVKSPHTIVKLTINHEAILDYPGKLIFFSYPFKLIEGDNRIVIAAADDAGQLTEKRILIRRKIPEAFQLKQRYCLSMYPFDHSDQKINSKLFQYHFVKSIFEAKRFQLIVRDDLSHFIHDTGAVQSVANISPHAMIFGSIYKSIHGIEITAEIVDKKSESHEFIDVYAPTGSPLNLASVGKELSEKLHRKFPLMIGTITHVATHAAIVTPISRTPEKSAVKMRWPVVAFRNNTFDSAERGSDSTIIGESMVTHIMADDYGTEIIPGLQPGDGVITR